MIATPNTVLHVCTTCRAGLEPVPGIPVPGARLHAGVAALLDRRPDGAVGLSEAKCLSNCDRGCSAALTGPGKWSYLLGDLDAGHAADLLAYAALYAASVNGVIMPSRRPASLARVVHGRIPPPA